MRWECSQCSPAATSTATCLPLPSGPAPNQVRAAPSQGSTPPPPVIREQALLRIKSSLSQSNALSALVSTQRPRAHMPADFLFVNLVMTSVHISPRKLWNTVLGFWPGSTSLEAHQSMVITSTTSEQQYDSLSAVAQRVTCKCAPLVPAEDGALLVAVQQPPQITALCRHRQSVSRSSVPRAKRHIARRDYWNAYCY